MQKPPAQWSPTPHWMMLGSQVLTQGLALPGVPLPSPLPLPATHTYPGSHTLGCGQSPLASRGTTQQVESLQWPAVQT